MPTALCVEPSNGIPVGVVEDKMLCNCPKRRRVGHSTERPRTIQGLPRSCECCETLRLLIRPNCRPFLSPTNMLFCPTCANLLVISSETGYNKWACNTCAYEFPISKQVGATGFCRASANEPADDLTYENDAQSGRRCFGRR